MQLCSLPSDFNHHHPCGGWVQGIWWDDVPMMMLPHMTEDAAEGLMKQGLRSLHQLRQAALGQPAAMKTSLVQLLGGSKQAAECLQVCSCLLTVVYD